MPKPKSSKNKMRCWSKKTKNLKKENTDLKKENEVVKNQKSANGCGGVGFWPSPWLAEQAASVNAAAKAEEAKVKCLLRKYLLPLVKKT